MRFKKGGARLPAERGFRSPVPKGVGPSIARRVHLPVCHREIGENLDSGRRFSATLIDHMDRHECRIPGQSIAISARSFALDTNYAIIVIDRHGAPTIVAVYLYGAGIKVTNAFDNIPYRYE